MGENRYLAYFMQQSLDGSNPVVVLGYGIQPWLYFSVSPPLLEVGMKRSRGQALFLVQGSGKQTFQPHRLSWLPLSCIPKGQGLVWGVSDRKKTDWSIFFLRGLRLAGGILKPYVRNTEPQSASPGSACFRVLVPTALSPFLLKAHPQA